MKALLTTGVFGEFNACVTSFSTNRWMCLSAILEIEKELVMNSTETLH